MDKYEKHSISQQLIESEGWTNDIPEMFDSRIIYPENQLTSIESSLLRRTYGYSNG